MATSGTTTFTLQIDDVIEEAYERCGIETRSGYDLKSAKRSLNLLLQGMQNEHAALWKMTRTTLSLVQGQTTYTLDDKVLDISDVVLTRSSVDTTMLRINRSDYQNRPNKTTESRPSQYYFEKTATPTLYIYPAPENSTDTLSYYNQERIEDVTQYTETIDIPINALPVITTGLAYMLSLKKALDRVPMLKALFDEEMIRFGQIDSEVGSLYLIASNDG